MVLFSQLKGFRKYSQYYKMLPQVIFVLGGPGAGKGTQCANIVKDYGFVHLSAGDLLRAERQTPGSKFGDLIEKHIREGSIVPVEITCSLLEKAMNQSEKNKFLIDGFPRNKNNLEGWEKQMSRKVDLLFVLLFECSQELCVQRCLQRGACGSGRSDDNEESLRKRIQTFLNETMPIIEHYDKLGLVKHIDSDKNVDEVYEDVKKVFDQLHLKSDS